MQRVEMIETDDGSPDGVTVTRFQAGQSYNLPDELAERFIAKGVAKAAGGGKAAQSPEAAATDGESPEPDAGTSLGAAETPEDGADGDGPSDDQVAAAIRGLDAEDPDHWTSGGKPDVRAIADALDARVYAAQRDRVWAAMQAEG